VRDQVSHPYSTTKEITVLYILDKIIGYEKSFAYKNRDGEGCDKNMIFFVVLHYLYIYSISSMGYFGGNKFL
jgi:hypothetical protein